MDSSDSSEPSVYSPTSQETSQGRGRSPKNGTSKTKSITNWTCTKCTYLNTQKSFNCAMCNSVRMSSRRSKSVENLYSDSTNRKNSEESENSSSQCKADVPLKRGRGRPPKKVVARGRGRPQTKVVARGPSRRSKSVENLYSDSTNRQNSEESENSSSQCKADVPLKRGRGRPPKKVVARGRGRPPTKVVARGPARRSKSVENLYSDSTNRQNSEGRENSSSQCKADVPLKRGRGRPPKKVVARGRGRPPTKVVARGPARRSKSVENLYSDSTNRQNSEGRENSSSQCKADVPLKRGRGRPPKKVVARGPASGEVGDKLLGTLEAEEHQLDDDVNQHTVIKKRRGRPPKNCGELISERDTRKLNANIGNDLGGAMIKLDKLKRGRPPKRYLEPNNESNPLENNDVSISLKRGRGRPPKKTTAPVVGSDLSSTQKSDLVDNELKVEMTEQHIDSDAVKNALTKRKRGRPPKRSISASAQVQLGDDAKEKQGLELNAPLKITPGLSLKKELMEETVANELAVDMSAPDVYPEDFKKGASDDLCIRSDVSIKKRRGQPPKNVQNSNDDEVSSVPELSDKHALNQDADKNDRNIIEVEHSIRSLATGITLDASPQNVCGNQDIANSPVHQMGNEQECVILRPKLMMKKGAEMSNSGRH
ncbi:hypothetical protein ACOME3_003176 [Neoechinorhynchus agilis]